MPSCPSGSPPGITAASRSKPNRWGLLSCPMGGRNWTRSGRIRKNASWAMTTRSATTRGSCRCRNRRSASVWPAAAYGSVSIWMERSACTTGPIGSAAMTPQGPYWSARAGERRLPEESELPDGHDRSQRGRREYRNGDRLPVYCSADRRSQGILERKIPRNPVDGGQPGHPSIRLDCGAASLRSTAPQSNYTTTTGHFICYRKRTSSLATDSSAGSVFSGREPRSPPGPVGSDPDRKPATTFASTGKTR